MRRAKGLTAVLAVALALAGCRGVEETSVLHPDPSPFSWETAAPAEREAPPSRGSGPGSAEPDPVPPAPTVTLFLSPTETPTPTEPPTPTPTPTGTPTTSEPPSRTAEPQPTPTTVEPEPQPSPPGRGSRLERLEVDAVELTNAERARHGCPELRVDDRLVAAARGHSEDMAERDYFSHTSPEGDGPGERAAAEGYDWWSGENIAMGYRTAEAVVEGWMDSSGHRANILNCDSVAIGIGVADSSSGPYWTQVFGRR